MKIVHQLPVKKKLISSPAPMHYNPSLPVQLVANASPYRVGAVISHILPDMSRTLSGCEQKYAQIKKEALSLIFRNKIFHQFLFGIYFTLVTDHKTLTAILSPKRGKLSLAAACMQHWALLLAGYKYDIHYRPTSAHCNADGLSRLPLVDSSFAGDYNDATVFNVGQLEVMPVQASQVSTATRTNPILRQVLRYARTG